MAKKSNNPLDHVRVKQRGSSWSDMPQSRTQGSQASKHTTHTLAPAQRKTMPASALQTTWISGTNARAFPRETTHWSCARRTSDCTSSRHSANTAFHLLRRPSSTNLFSKSAKTDMPMKRSAESSATSPRLSTMQYTRWSCCAKTLPGLSRCRAKNSPLSANDSRGAVSRTTNSL